MRSPGIIEAELGEGFSELCCHPGYVDGDLASSYTHERETELETLCDPELAALLSEPRDPPGHVPRGASSMTTVVISPYRATKFLDRAGNFWVYLQYALGLQAIGCDVHWLERLEEPGPGWEGIDASRASRRACSAKRSRGSDSRTRPILYTTPGENDSAFEPSFVGMTEAEAEKTLGRADLLLNFHQKIHPELLARVERTALVDIDPGLLQYWISSGLLDVPAHDVYFTIGETVGTAGRDVPGLRHRLGAHPAAGLPRSVAVHGRRPRRAPFTTVSSWHGDEYVMEGRRLLGQQQDASLG